AQVGGGRAQLGAHERLAENSNRLPVRVEAQRGADVGEDAPNRGRRREAHERSLAHGRSRERAAWAASALSSHRAPVHGSPMGKIEGPARFAYDSGPWMPR